MSAAPAQRKASVWEKIFKPNKKEDATELDEAVSSPFAHSETDTHEGATMFSGFDISGKKASTTVTDEPTSPVDGRRRQMSLATGLDSQAPTPHLRNGSVTPRKASVAAPSPNAPKSPSGRSGSISGAFARRGSKRWFSTSSNPEDLDAPPVPAIDRKFSIFGSHNPDVQEEPAVPSPPASRRPSYVPRNAAAGFMKTTTQKPGPKPSGEDEDVIRAHRQLSVAGPSRLAPSNLRPADVKITEVRKDSHVGPEKHGMFSMSGICDIMEDANEEQADESSVSSTSVSHTSVSTTSEKKIDSLINQSTQRADSAKGSPELLATKTETQKEPSLLEGTAV